VGPGWVFDSGSTSTLVRKLIASGEIWASVGIRNSLDVDSIGMALALATYLMLLNVDRSSNSDPKCPRMR